MKRRTDKNSATAAVQGFAGVLSDVPLPDGIELRSDLERATCQKIDVRLGHYL